MAGVRSVRHQGPVGDQAVVPLPGRHCREAAGGGKAGGSAGGVVHHLGGQEGAGAPGAGEQGVDRVCGGVSRGLQEEGPCGSNPGGHRRCRGRSRAVRRRRAPSAADRREGAARAAPARAPAAARVLLRCGLDEFVPRLYSSSERIRKIAARGVNEASSRNQSGKSRRPLSRSYSGGMSLSRSPKAS